MQKKFTVLLPYYFILLLLVHASCSARIYLHGYHRCGNHLLSYSINHILNKPVIGDPYSGKNIPIPEDAIAFSHRAKTLGLDRANHSRDFLIVIVRDYHECLLRDKFNYVSDYSQIKPEQIIAEERIKCSNIGTQNCYSCNELNYINCLRCYDRWNEQRRYLIYYEDLITHFEETIQGCLDKFNITQHYLQEFMQHYDERMFEIKQIYRKHQKATLSEGDIHYHKNRLLTTDQAKRFDAIYRTNFPILFEKYLKRYETLP